MEMMFLEFNTYREANKCADALARRGALLSQDFVIFHCPPADLALLFHYVVAVS